MEPLFLNDTGDVSILKIEMAYIRSYNVLSYSSFQWITQGEHDDILPVGIDVLRVNAHR